MNGIFLALGSNLGEKTDNLNRAIEELNARNIKVIQCSSFKDTKPVGGPPQDNFLNAVVKVKTALNPHDLLHEIKSIEKDLGRRKTVRNGPRVIDIDILLYHDVTLETDTLTIPHPKMFGRSFVMEPLSEIAPHITIQSFYSLGNHKIG